MDVFNPLDSPTTILNMLLSLHYRCLSESEIKQREYFGDQTFKSYEKNIHVYQ
jgi:hypothetical protein